MSTVNQKNKKAGKTPQQKPWVKKAIRWMWIGFVALVLFIGIFFVLVYNGVIGYMPPVEELKNPQDKFASVIYTSDGEEMGRYFRNTGNRVYADFDEISPAVVDALIATEDARFEDHSGIDVKAIARAMVKTVLLHQKNAGGGSTITQQLAKQLYTPPSNGLLQRAVQKPIEWMIAIKLERFYSKEEILKMYLNQFDFLYNAVGIKSAAKVYFNKEAAELDTLEAATLVGMVKNPSYFNPVRHPERTKERRNVVLEQMYKADMLTRDEVERLKAEPLALDFRRVDHKDGLAPYFREELRRYLTAKKPERSAYPSWDTQKYVDDSIAWATNPLYGWIEKTRKPDGTKYDIYNDGLKIYTTIDSRMQTYAEEAVHEHMKSLQAQFFKEKKGSSAAPYTSNRGELSDAERTLRDTYRRVLTLCNSEDAIAHGQFFDLMYVNYDNAAFNPHRHFAFLRKSGYELLLIAVNFGDEAADLCVNIPSHAFDCFGIRPAMLDAVELLGGDAQRCYLSPDQPFATHIDAHGAVIWKMIIDKKSRSDKSRKTKKS